MKYYAGIGARNTPQNVLSLMENIAYFFSEKGYVLRSGGADGADSAFEKGCDKANGEKEIFLPWAGFNNNQSELWLENMENKNKATEIASKFHPKWSYLRSPVRRLMARNTFQVMGPELKKNNYSEFVICYCEKNKNGEYKGGTAQALRIAEKLNLNIYNLYDKVVFEKFLNKVK